MAEAFNIFDGELVKYEGSDREVIIPDEVTLIRDFAFYGCEKLEKVVIGSQVTSIGSYAFYSCDHLIDIQIADSVTLIGGGAFSSCKKLETITLPGSLKTIQKSTFYKCDALKNVYLPDSITSIDHSAFGFCVSLETIELPASLVHIGANAFEECAALKKVILPDTVTTVGDNAFFHCTQLSEIIASKQLKEVGKGAFQTHSTLSFRSNETLFLRSFMFDGNWNLNWSYSFRYKNGDNYCLINSYLPHLKFREWKPLAKIVLLVNFLETYDRHQGEDKAAYCQNCQEHKKELLDFLVEQKRFTALNQAMISEIFTSLDLQPYLDRITDREERAKLMEFGNKEAHSGTSLDDLENELMHMF